MSQNGSSLFKNKYLQGGHAGDICLLLLCLIIHANLSFIHAALALH